MSRDSILQNGLGLVMGVHVASLARRVATKLCMRTDGRRGRENERYREQEREAEEVEVGGDENGNENEDAMAPNPFWDRMNQCDYALRVFMRLGIRIRDSWRKRVNG
jgi:hypothetical protein